MKFGLKIGERVKRKEWRETLSKMKTNNELKIEMNENERKKTKKLKRQNNRDG